MHELTVWHRSGWVTCGRFGSAAEARAAVLPGLRYGWAVGYRLRPVGPAAG
jgi:hypothetical protein